RLLNSKLSHRQAGKLLLTPCGDKFNLASRTISGLYDGALKSIRALGTERPADEIKISTIYSAGIYMIQNYVRQFLAHNPGTKVSVEYRQFSQIYADIASGRADFGFMACPYRKSPGLAMLPVAKDEMVLIAGSSSPLAGRKSVGVKDLDGLDFIFFDRAFPSRRYIDTFLRRHGIKVRVKMELDNIETIKTAVASGAGVSILPRSVVRDHENGISLHVMRIADAEFLRPIYLIYSRARKLTPPARAFMSIFEGARKVAAGKC
ncbi:MAG: LysR family transcriptional regulator substrate-binding protein, partial [Elusimicrobia bacterium]|nr:LysR family transcriptional regulator substrate-binding protein [Elusimicrobiota bacterium]